MVLKRLLPFLILPSNHLSGSAVPLLSSLFAYLVFAKAAAVERLKLLEVAVLPKFFLYVRVSLIEDRNLIW
jgi:hypothetical protein